MALNDNIARIRSLLDKVSQFEHLVAGETFEPKTINDMKTKAKALCDTIKTEADNIKHEIGDWG